MKKLALIALVLATPLAAAPKPDPVAAALADPARPAADKARDAARKPAELVKFARVKPGQTVVDFIMGGGYLTRVLAGTVGPKGKVIAYQPAEFIAFRAAYGTEQDVVVTAHRNVTPLRPGLDALALPDGVDAIVTVQNYHDMHLSFAKAGTAETVNAIMFKALKPGGTLVVVDHSAVAGAPREVADSLHRIDPARVRAEVEKAGFVFDGELDTWRNPADPRTGNVFAPDIRSRTDQFAYRFRKPK